MDKFTLYVPNFLPFKEYFQPAKNLACPGCGLALAVRLVYKGLANLIETGVWISEGERIGEREGAFILQIKNDLREIQLFFDNEAQGDLTRIREKLGLVFTNFNGFSYIASACPSYPFDLIEKLKKSMLIEGKSFIHILSPCPVGWGFDPELTVKIGRFAVESRVFPLYEKEGESLKLTVVIPKPRVLKDYLRLQRRFDELSEREIEEASSQIEQNYQKLIDKVQKS